MERMAWRYLIDRQTSKKILAAITTNKG